MRFYIIISIFLSLEYASSTYQNFDGNSDCLTDELYGDFTDEEYNNLVKRRKFVRTRLQNQLYRNETDTLFVPVVFHNLYKVVDNEAKHSYCDYIKGSTKPLKDDDGDILETNFAEDEDYTSGNNQSFCKQRIDRSLNILNSQYLPSGIQFTLHPDYNEMLHDTISGFDGFFENATVNNLPTANDIKEKYNIQNVLNIYTTDCLGFGGITTGYTTCASGLLGFSLYPWNLKSNEPGIFIVHKDMPGSDDHGDPNISTLAHEIGHFFSLLHINGIWFWDEDNIPRELVDGSDCDIHGDLICDTPGSPGHEPDAWNTEECIYHGYGGEYVDSTGILKIGGYNKISPIPINYNYCSQWGLPGDPHKTEPPYYIRAFDTTDSLIPPGCGNLITFDLEGVPTKLSDIHFREEKGKSILPGFGQYFPAPTNSFTEITDGCDLDTMWVHITANGNVLYKSSVPIWGFQFKIDDARILGVSGGIVQENNFNIQLDHCYNYTNYDNEGYFFGSRGVGVECQNNDPSEFATECHIDNYSHYLWPTMY